MSFKIKLTLKGIVEFLSAQLNIAKSTAQLLTEIANNQTVINDQSQISFFQMVVNV